MKKDIGERIALARENAGLKQRELAAQMNISTSLLGQYETGASGCPTDKIILISEICGVSTDWLLKGDGEQPVSYQLPSIADRMKGSINDVIEELKATYENQIAEYRRREEWYQEQLSKPWAA